MISAYIMDESGEWRLETVDDEVVDVGDQEQDQDIGEIYFFPDVPKDQRAGKDQRNKV